MPASENPTRALPSLHEFFSPGGILARSSLPYEYRTGQLQILRLTTPNLHPTNEDLFVGTPERLKSTPGAPFAQDDSNFLCCVF